RSMARARSRRRDRPADAGGARRDGPQAAGGEAGRQHRRGGPGDPGPGGSPAGGTCRHHGRRRPAGGRARGDAEVVTMAIWLTKDSRVIVQGMTGSEGSKHTRRMLAAGTTIVGGVTPGKGGQQVEV